MDPRIWLVTADLGFGLWDTIKKDFPERFINTGAAEQAAMGLCIGLAVEGKVPVFYSISTFAVLRPFELIRNYLHNEQIPVKIVGGGRDKDYKIDGYSHNATDIKSFMKPFKIMQYYPEEKETWNDNFREFLFNEKPSYLNLKR
jgi:transketolase